MKISKLVLPIAAASLLATTAVAETEEGMIKCGSYNVRAGATKKEVRHKCGKPSSETDTEWHYHRETHKIQIVYFEGDKIVRITAQKTAGQ